MKRLLRRLARSLAPTAYAKLEALGVREDGTVAVDMSDARTVALEARVRDLEVQLKEVRQDNRRVAELYDLVFERLRSDRPLD